MKNLRLLFIPVICSYLFAISGCEEEPFSAEEPTAKSGINSKTAETPASERPIDDLTDHSGGTRYPYPEIIHQTFIPEDDLYNRKCLTWRITWPDYAEGYDVTKIPTVFSANGALNSIHFLNNVDPQNTYNTIFSLYHENKIQRSSDMGNELNYAVTPPSGSMELVLFNDMYITAEAIETMVKNSPSDFQFYWQQVNPLDELAYEEGDFLFFSLGEPSDDKLYGAIQIVSMTPRIIEVYLAVENN